MAQWQIPLVIAQGYKVITTGNETSRARLEKLGVEKFLNYKTEDYTKAVASVDAVIDPSLEINILSLKVNAALADVAHRKSLGKVIINF